jgi:hypothetical protein
MSFFKKESAIQIPSILRKILPVATMKRIAKLAKIFFHIHYSCHFRNRNFDDDENGENGLKISLFSPWQKWRKFFAIFAISAMAKIYIPPGPKYSVSVINTGHAWSTIQIDLTTIYLID